MMPADDSDKVTVDTEAPSGLARFDLEENNLITDEESCTWTKFGPWSQCSQSCGGGLQIRLRRTDGESRYCKEGRREARWCNTQSCPSQDTTTTTQQPVVTFLTDEPQPAVITDQDQTPLQANPTVRCYRCGSLFSPQDTDCTQFDPEDPDQQVRCQEGEVCLYYSWNTDSVIRECFMPGSVLLGDINDPILPSETCSLQAVDSSSFACTCTTDLCNG